VSGGEDTISLESAVAGNLVLGSPWHSSPSLMAVLVLPYHGDMFLLNDFITDEGESCLVFERKGTVQSFCES